MLRDNKNIFEQEEEICYKLVRVNSFWGNNYIEYENNSDRNKTPSVEQNLDKISPYLKVIRNNLKKSDTLKIQLTIAKNFIFSIDNDEEQLMHSNIEKILK